MTKKEDGEKKEKVELDMSPLEDLFNNLATSFGQGMAALGDKVDVLMESAKTTKKETKAADDDTLPNLEVMDRKEFMGVMVDQVGKKISKLIDDSITEKLQPISDRLKVTDDEADELAKSQAAKEYAEVKGSPMWTGLLPVMQELFKQNPALSPKQLLSLAKADNPEKVKEIEDANPDLLKEKVGDDKEESRVDDEGFGGLLPTSTLKGATVEKMDGDQAAEKAWTKVFGAKKAVTAD
jgi:hypothetical protein